jgi:hypothetical protein
VQERKLDLTHAAAVNLNTLVSQSNHQTIAAPVTRVSNGDMV